MKTLLRPWRSLTRSPLRRAFSIAGAALGVVCWLALAPAALGGSSTYVTTYGASMEPTLHRGDLAIVRAQPSYRVGDIVAYRSASLHTIVLHRIIGRDGDRFVFKGDNNTWVDTDRPSAGELVGEMEMRLPGLGDHVQRAASPPGVASLATLAAFPIATGRRRRRRGSNETGPARHLKSTRSWPSWGHVEPRLLMATAVVLGAVAFSFSRPSTNQTTSDLPFDDRGEFSYTGEALGGTAAYQAEHVSSGQPIFLNLVDRVEIKFTYSASSTSPVVAAGELSLSGTVMDTDGWAYPFDLAEPTPFEGGGTQTSGTLDLSDLRAMIVGMETATGVARDSYTVLIEAYVNREVHSDDAVSAGVFAAILEFKLDDLEMYLAAPGGDALTPSQGGLLSVPLERANHIDILGQSLSIAGVRAVAMALTLIIAALWIGWLLRTARGDETSLIERRYRGYLLPVRTAELTSGLIIDVESINALARIADHTGAPILHGDGDEYHVIDGTRVYRYKVTAIDAGHPEARVEP
jgi:signal peptidase I